MLGTLVVFIIPQIILAIIFYTVIKHSALRVWSIEGNLTTFGIITLLLHALTFTSTLLYLEKFV